MFVIRRKSKKYGDGYFYKLGNDGMFCISVADAIRFTSKQDAQTICDALTRDAHWMDATYSVEQHNES